MDVSFSLVAMEEVTGKGQQESHTIQNFPVRENNMACPLARWEEKTLIEEENEKLNDGGLVFIYNNNTSGKRVSMMLYF